MAAAAAAAIVSSEIYDLRSEVKDAILRAPITIKRVVHRAVKPVSRDFFVFQ